MIMKTDKLYSADFGFDEPFEFALGKGEVFHAEKVVRIIPKRRMVAFGQWQGQPTVAKLFFDKKRAKRHMEKELAGVSALQKSHIPSPELLGEFMTEDCSCRVLLFKQIAATSLDVLWQNKRHISEILLILHAVMVELATQHVMGVLQRDLHLKNFLIELLEDPFDSHEATQERVRVYTLDGGQIEMFPALLAKKESMSSVALFLSQLGAGMESYQQLLFRYYAKQRGWIIKRSDIIELFKLIGNWGAERWQRYERKIWRDSTDFAKISRWTATTVFDRKYTGPDFIRLLSHPDMAFTGAHALILKAGRSCTVAKVTLDGREFVVKRYNIKGFFHWLRRALRPTRAASCWRLAQKLKLFQVPTAQPAAYIENRCLGLRGKSYFIMEHVHAYHMGQYLDAHSNNPEILGAVTARVTTLLKNLLKLNVTHGDLKMTNILIDADDQPLLIDLDGMREHDSHASLRKTWRKEAQRFLRNFSGQASLREGFMQSLRDIRLI